MSSEVFPNGEKEAMEVMAMGVFKVYFFNRKGRKVLFYYTEIHGEKIKTHRVLKASLCISAKPLCISV
jgi:hypothetical protein